MFGEDSSVLMDHYDSMVDDRINMSEIFDSSPRESVSFEIAFTAFFATLVLSVPPTSTLLDSFAWISAIGLLFLTLVRRMAIDHRWIKPRKVMDRTMGYILYMTVFGVYYVSLSLGETTSTGGMSVYFVAAIILYLTSTASLIGYEVLFQDLFLWGAIGGYNRQIKEPNYTFGGKVILHAIRTLIDNYPVDFRKDHPMVEPIFERELPETSKQGNPLIPIVLFAIGTLLVIAVLASPIIFMLRWSVVDGMLVTLGFFLATIQVAPLVQFVYARYGNTSFDQVTTLFSTVKSLLVFYFVVIVYEGVLDISISIL